MVDAQLALIKEAVSRGQDETILATVALAREWARIIEAAAMPYTAPEALRLYADTLEKQWAATGAGVAHAAAE